MSKRVGLATRVCKSGPRVDRIRARRLFKKSLYRNSESRISPQWRQSAHFRQDQRLFQRKYIFLNGIEIGTPPYGRLGDGWRSVVVFDNLDQ